MKTRKGPKQAPASELFEADKPQEAPSQEPAESPDKKPRLQFSFDLKPDGSPDFESMRGSTREKLRQIFNDPQITGAFGAPSNNGKVDFIHPAAISGLYDALGAIEALLFPL